MNAGEQEYFFVVDMLDITDGLGHPLAPLKEHALVFQAPVEKARGTLFVHGYNLDSEEGLFTDNGVRFVSEMYETTDGSNSTEDDVPDRVRILAKSYPLLRVFPDARFGKLHVQRTIAPKMSGGKRKAQTRRSRRYRSRRATLKRRS
jgi:hypothetical protein